MNSFHGIFSPFQVLWSNVLWTISTLQSFATKTKKLSSSQKNHFIYALVYFGKKLSRFLVKNQTKIQGASEKQRNYDIVNAKKTEKNQASSYSIFENSKSMCYHSCQKISWKLLKYLKTFLLKTFCSAIFHTVWKL